MNTLFPSDESTLIGLFTSAINKLDKDFNVFAYFRNAQYDGKFIWSGPEPLSDADLKILEFKLSLDDLIDEFETSIHDKEFNEVDLIIVWDRNTNRSGWAVKGISDAKRDFLERKGVPTDLVEYILEDSHGHYRPMICVADFLNKIPKIMGADDDLDRYVEELG